jgi:ATP-dependent DNA ligase
LIAQDAVNASSAASRLFDDPIRLLAAGEKMQLEGIVSKRRESAYRSGTTRDWLKIKTAAWREANRDRYEHFQKRETAR